MTFLLLKSFFVRISDGVLLACLCVSELTVAVWRRRFKQVCRQTLLSTITASLFPEMKPNVSLISQSKRLQRHVEWAAEKEAERKRSRN